MGQLPDEVVEIHAHVRIQFDEFDDHSFPFIYSANDASDVEALREHDARGKFGAEPERLGSFEVHPSGANVAKRGVQCYFTPRDFNRRVTSIARVFAPFGTVHSPPVTRAREETPPRIDAMQTEARCQIEEDLIDREKIQRERREFPSAV